jgi:hypothetical protein
MDINAKAIQKALTILDALGAQYKVVTKGGDEFGTLVVVAAKSPRTSRTNLIQFGYKDQIRALKLGECQRFTAPDGVSAAQYRSVLSAAAHQIYGKGAVMTSVDSRRNTIDALRIQ